MPPLLDEVRALLVGVSAEASAFDTASGLACRTGCGACCESPTVESTVLELLPMAVALHEAGFAEATLDRLEGAEDPYRCIAYEAAPGRPGSGRCMYYEHRPTVCRVFGSGAFRHATGRLDFVTCGIRREDQPAAVARAESMLESPAAAPVFGDVGRRVRSLHPGLGAERMPLNAALARAIAWVALRRREADAGE